MVKHTQTICHQIADELSVFDHFVKLALKGLMKNFIFCTVTYVPWISECEEIESEKSKT